MGPIRAHIGLQEDLNRKDPGSAARIFVKLSPSGVCAAFCSLGL